MSFLKDITRTKKGSEFASSFSSVVND